MVGLGTGLALGEVREFATPREAERNIVRAIERVAVRLGNTPAICRKCYVHPDVLQAYLDGVRLREQWGPRDGRLKDMGARYGPHTPRCSERRSALFALTVLR